MTEAPRPPDIKEAMEIDFSNVEREVLDFTRDNPNVPAGFLRLAEVCLRKNDAVAMEEAATRALNIQPGNARGQVLLALAQSLRGKYAEAAESVRQVCLLSPEVEVCLDRGTYLHRSGKLEEALQTFLLAVDLATDNQYAPHVFLAKFGLARVYRDLGRVPLANRKLDFCDAQYKKLPLLMSSNIVRYYSSRDFHEWDNFKRKDHLASMLGISGGQSSGGQSGGDPSGGQSGGQSDGAQDRDHLRAPVSFNLPGDGESFAAYARENPKPMWILKPNSLFGGQGIRVFEDPAKIPLDEDCVIQEYVSNPALVNGCKAHLRLYLVFMSADPLHAWFWRDGLARFAPEPFIKAEGWLENAAIHVTNTALHHGHPNVKFSEDQTVENFGTVWGLKPYLEALATDGVGVEDLLDRLADNARALVKRIDQAGFFKRAGALPPSSLVPKLIGMDMLLDDDLQPWFIEIQRNPGQTGQGPVNEINGRLYKDFYRLTDAMLRTQPGSLREGQDLVLDPPTAFTKIR